ncbi:MAG: SDR family oxidoreductase [Actinobacteria bacterium]|nr:SDR family oxidoreductase [Actinomycetota bacterium]
MADLAGKSLLVVGGGSGIGFAAARLAVEGGATVTVADLDPASEAAVAGLGPAARFVAADATDLDSMRAALAVALDASPRLDAVFTTVGGAHLAPLEELDPAAWDAEVSFNLRSAYAVARAVQPQLEAQGAGAIVTTSSGYALMAGTDRPAYVAAKAGVIAFTRTLAAALAPHRVRANCIAPGPTDTPRFRAMNGGEEGVEAVRRAMPMGEIPTPEDCARVALFLLSDEARQVTGQVIHVNGGLLMP